MVGPAHLAHQLRALITALDRRPSRAETPGEADIARDAATLREQAVTRLAEIAALPDTMPDAAPDGPLDRGLRLEPTPFPAVPQDVAVLTIQEFTSELGELDPNRVPSLQHICRTFVHDANRALVWWIRFEALQSWCASPDVLARTAADGRILKDASEVAASFPLNRQWRFDATAFGRAVDGIALKRARTEG